MDELTEDEIDDLIESPDNIPTKEACDQIIAVLDHEIAEIQMQLEAAGARMLARTPSEEEENWIRRASYAKAMRANDRHKIYQRRREIRGTKIIEHAGQSKEKAVAKIAKNERLLAEAEVRRLAKAAKLEEEKTAQMRIAQERRELKAKQSLQHHFMLIAKEKLSEEIYSSLVDEARKRIAPD